MTKTMRLMALGLSVVVFTGCSAVDDLIEGYTDDAEEEYQGYQDGGDTNSGGNNDPKPVTVTGVFQDANVAGLNYACSSGKTDVTNNEGEYTCNVGDAVEFSLGDYVLGSVIATSGIVTPMSLYPYDLEAATDVLQLLQTLDSGEDGTITIPDNFSALDDVEAQPGNADFDSDMEYELGEALVSEDDAQEHMLKTLLAGKTLYTTIWDDIGTMESWSFNADMTQATWVELVGGNESGTNAISSVAGMTITIADDEGATEIMVKEILADYLVLEVSGGELGSEIEILRLYFDEAKARAYLLAGSSTVDLTALLAGKTVYTTIWDEMGTLESSTFNADMTSVTWQEMVGGSDTGTEALSVNGMTMTFSDGSETSTVVVTEILEDYMLVSMNGGNAQRLYFDETKARTYLLSASGSSTGIAITEAMLSGKTFYDTFTDYNGDVCYANMTMSATSGTRHEVCYTSDGSEKGNETFTFTVAFIDSKIRVDAGDEYKWFTLTAEDAMAWHMINDDDDGKDGTLDSIGEENTWYFSKPAGFPESL